MSGEKGKPTLRNGTAADKALDAVLAEFWFDLGGGQRARFNERERKALVEHLEDKGYRIVRRRRQKNRD